MGRTINNLCDSCINIGCEFQSGIVRTKCAFYMPPCITSDNYITNVLQEPTIKNDLHCQCTDEEIAKSFIEDVEAVKNQLPCGEQMDFPSTFDEFAKEYGFKDKEEVYTNGSELISVFRVKQWLEHISTTKNDLGVDCVSRQAINGYIDYILSHGMGKKKSFGFIKKFVANLPSVTPKEPKSEWEHDHDILKAYSNGANEALDMVRAEIDNVLSDGMIHKKTVLGIIDKYKNHRSR